MNRIVDALKKGEIVALPTETVWGLCTLATERGYKRLKVIKQRKDKPFAIFLPSINTLYKIATHITQRRRALIDNFFPGPMTVIVNTKKSFQKQFPFLPSKVGVRIPAIKDILSVLRAVNRPVLATSANISGREELSSCREIIEAFGNEVVCFDLDVKSMGLPSTVIDITQYPFSILRAGAIGPVEIRKIVRHPPKWNTSEPFTVLFVCSGNSCRSPMAEGMFRMMIPKDLNIRTASCGTLRFVGAPATIEAQRAVMQYNADISSHKSQAISRELLLRSHLILAMEEHHIYTISSIAPEVWDRCFLLGGFGTKHPYEIPDPIGMPQEIYNSIARLIHRNLKQVTSYVVKFFKEVRV